MVDTKGVIFFDAAGTLFEVRGSVGEAYGRIAREYGVEADLSELDQAFADAYRAQAPLAFAGLQGPTLEAAERRWWLRLVASVFGDRMAAPLLERYFDALYAHFRRADAWRLFPDVRPALDSLVEAGYRLGVVSNFDSRLDEILGELGVARYFEHVIASSRAGAAKPDPAIFRTALAAFGLTADMAWHVGDTPHEDVAGARAAGVRAVLLDRRGRHSGWSDSPRIATLDDFTRLIG